jgi:hypothetical protein
MVVVYLIEVTSQPLETADLHILEPRNPLPPQTTIFLAADMEPASEINPSRGRWAVSQFEGFH